MKRPVIKGDTITVPSHPEYLTDVDAFLEGTLRGFGAEESVVADIAISVSELVNNAVMHGNKQSRDKVVTVRINRENNTVLIAVSDEGTGFDPGGLQSPIEDDNLLKAVGRGIFIVRSLMDTIDIEPGPHGTTITIGKAIA